MERFEKAGLINRDDGSIIIHNEKSSDQNQDVVFLKKEKYMKIKLIGGNSYIQPLHILSNAFDAETDDAEVGAKWELELIEMYPHEYEELNDFAGH